MACKKLLPVSMLSPSRWEVDQDLLQSLVVDAGRGVLKIETHFAFDNPTKPLVVPTNAFSNSSPPKKSVTVAVIEFTCSFCRSGLQQLIMPKPHLWKSTGSDPGLPWSAALVLQPTRSDKRPAKGQRIFVGKRVQPNLSTIEVPSAVQSDDSQHLPGAGSFIWRRAEGHRPPQRPCTRSA